MANITIPTKGMTCSACETILKESLEDLDGISKAEASAQAGEVKVEFDDSKTTEQDIRNTIKEEGFDPQ